jgi:L-amino acid N-acyltransferase YncA
MSALRPALAPVTIRACGAADIGAITAIYAHYVRTSLATFDEIVPTEADMAQRRADAHAAALPFLTAADSHGMVLGFAYAGYYRPRAAYRFTLEDSIYVGAEMTRRGIGRALLTRLIEQCAAAGFRQLVAVVGDSANAASIGLHESVGFARVGLMPAVGFKRGRWVDSVMMQRRLGDGSATPPIS